MQLLAEQQSFITIDSPFTAAATDLCRLCPHDPEQVQPCAAHMHIYMRYRKHVLQPYLVGTGLFGHTARFVFLSGVGQQVSDMASCFVGVVGARALWCGLEKVGKVAGRAASPIEQQ